MAALLDQFGNALPATARQETMSATLTGSRPALSDSIVTLGLNPADVGALLRSAATGNSRDWQTLAELIEERDLHYLSVLGTRKRSVSQLPITVEPAGPSRAQKKHAEFVQNWLDKGIFQRSIFDILDAIAKGFSVHEIVWHCEAGNYYPKQLIYRPQRWFEISYQDGETIWLRDDESVAVPALAGAVAENGMRALEPSKALIHKHPSWSGLTLRAGLTRSIVFNTLFKLFSNRDWGVFVQAFGVPIRVGKFDASATDSDRRTLWRAVSDVAGSMGCIIPQSMEIDFVEPKNGAGANDTHERRIKWLDEQTSKAVLGQTGTTDARQGTHAAAVVHRLVQEDIERADAALLSFTLNSQLVRQMVDYSFGAPSDGLYPTVSVGRPDEAPIETLIDAVQKLGPQGFKVQADALYARLNLEAPENGDATVGMAVQPQNPIPAAAQPAQEKPPKISPSHVPTPTDRDPPEVKEETTLHAQLGRLVARQAPTSPHIVDALLDNLAREAASGLGAMTGAVRREVERATSLEDLRDRLEALDLPDDEFAEAMSRGLMMGELAGEAAMLEAFKHA